MPKEIRVPDIGDFSDVEIVDVMVAAGQHVAVEDPLLTLETDKAAMDVPSPFAGTIKTLHVAPGDKVSEGSLIAEIEVDAPGAEAPTTHESVESKPIPSATKALGSNDLEADLVVVGSGPGGYTAAFRAADLGRQVVLIERYPDLGGVCLNVGCIPSKALLHAANVIDQAEAMSEWGIRFGQPEVDPLRLREWKDGIVSRLTGGLKTLARQRKVRVLEGTATFAAAHQLAIESAEKPMMVGFKQCIIAAGSEVAWLPGLPDDPRIMDSTGALELEELPQSLLVVGGGIIGLEMATVYDALGVKVSVVELTPTLMPECDRDLVKPLQRRIEKRYEQILLGIKVKKITPKESGLSVEFDGENAPEPQLYGRVLVAVGRRPNGQTVEAKKAGVRVDERGFIPVDKQMRTNVEHIFAIGDITGPPMLAHKATHEGKTAAEVASGLKHAFDARAIPSVAYTDPEIAWVGLTENDANGQGVRYRKGVFPWAASGRSLALNRDEGFTKLLFEEQTGRIIGAGMVGPHAGDLVAETALAIEMGADASDIGLTIHPHPTLSETVGMAAEAYEGTITDLYMPRK